MSVLWIQSNLDLYVEAELEGNASILRLQRDKISVKQDEQRLPKPVSEATEPNSRSMDLVGRTSRCQRDH